MMKSTANNLIPRPGTADECAQAVMFCVENEFTTGNVIEGAQHSCALLRLLSRLLKGKGAGVCSRWWHHRLAVRTGGGQGRKGLECVSGM